MNNEVVITGLGIVSSLGCEIESFWERIKIGETGIRPLSKLNPDRYNESCVSSEIKEEIESPFKNESNCLNYAHHAIKNALKDALIKDTSKYEIGLILGTTNGNDDILQTIVDNAIPQEEKSANAGLQTLKVMKNKLGLFRSNPERLSSLLSKQFDFRGKSSVIQTACAAGNYALAEAYEKIKCGQSSIMIAGGVDAFNRSCYSVFYRLGGMTYDTCRPFAENRTGMVVGEGAGILVVESKEHAQKRGATIYAEIKGVGFSCDAYHPVAPHPEGYGAYLAINNALQQSGLDSGSVDLISTHGTGTKANDNQEYEALSKVFKGHLDNIPILTSKANLGHCMGAASAIESIISVLSIRDGTVPPNVNTNQVDSNFKNLRISSEAVVREIKNVLNNAFGFGGNICSLFIGK